jgi:Rrf2 family protein
MRMSEGVEWGIHCCSFLANLKEGESLSGGDLATFFDLPRAYLLKHLGALSRAGIVTTTTGPRGGYRLARPPAEITLLDIVVAIDGGETTFRCQEIRQRGPSGRGIQEYRGACGIAAAMWAAEDAWRDSLHGVTIASLGRLAEEQVPRTQKELSRQWLTQVRARRATAT